MEEEVGEALLAEAPALRGRDKSLLGATNGFILLARNSHSGGMRLEKAARMAAPECLFHSLNLGFPPIA